MWHSSFSMCKYALDNESRSVGHKQGNRDGIVVTITETCSKSSVKRIFNYNQPSRDGVCKNTPKWMLLTSAVETLGSIGVATFYQRKHDKA